MVNEFYGTFQKHEKVLEEKDWQSFFFFSFSQLLVYCKYLLQEAKVHSLHFLVFLLLKLNRSWKDSRIICLRNLMTRD